MSRRRPQNSSYERRRLMHEQGGRCHWCGEHMQMTSRRPGGQPGASYPTFEHVTRREDGGGTARNNIVLACLKCNQKRERRPNRWAGGARLVQTDQQ